MSGPRTPLLRPGRYFAAHDGTPPLKHAALAVLAVTIATAAGGALIIDQLAAALDVTVTVDNPAYPGDVFCDGDGDTPSGCTEPKTVERELGAMVAEEFSWLPFAALLLVPVWWLLQATILHLASALANGEGSFGGTLVAAGWGMVPSLVRIAGVAVFIAISVQSLSVPADPEGAVQALQSALAGAKPLSFALAVLAAVWGGAIRTYGLADARDLSRWTAGWIVGILTVVGLLFELG